MFLKAILTNMSSKYKTKKNNQVLEINLKIKISWNLFLKTEKKENKDNKWLQMKSWSINLKLSWLVDQIQPQPL